MYQSVKRQSKANNTARRNTLQIGPEQWLAKLHERDLYSDYVDNERLHQTVKRLYLNDITRLNAIFFRRYDNKTIGQTHRTESPGPLFTC